MFKPHKDKKAAERLFELMIKAHEGTLAQPASRKVVKPQRALELETLERLNPFFVRGFTKEYHSNKKLIQSCVNMTDFYQAGYVTFKSSLKFLTYAKSYASELSEGRAESLGRALGAFIAGFRYLIASERFMPKSSDALTILDVIKQIAGLIKQMNIKFTGKFIETELTKIGRENYRKLTSDQMMNIAEVSSQFS